MISVGKLIEFIKDEDGVTAIEYGLIAALIAIVIIGGVTFIGESLNSKFSNIGSELDTAS
ncbi:MAG: Flp family type IVb pilin [Candidatus Lokiarchaeota archaeon]|nr:Flp family type IVb pilin [Candidatus Lokiarchaeota archaeon]